MRPNIEDKRFLVIAPRCVIKRLEVPCLYDIVGDELYEINDQAMEFVERCGSERPPMVGQGDPEFEEIAISEGLLEPASEPRPRVIDAGNAPDPSLRYLELHVTRRCNLRCRHCYIADGGGDMDPQLAAKAANEFARMGGLRLLVTGGEPLVYPHLWELNDLLPKLEVHSILITNGTLLDRESVARLNFHEVQVSLDGMEGGNDFIRGRGNFARAAGAIDLLLEAGVRVSVGTMVHAGNLDEMKALEQWIVGRGIEEWNVDAPMVAGRLAAEREIYPGHKKAAQCLMEFGFGGGRHEAYGKWACGAHLGAVLPNGDVVPCPFFEEIVGGNAAHGLERAWGNLPRFLMDDVGCDCEFIEECRGGCRFRAKLHQGINGPDPVRCAMYKGAVTRAQDTFSR